MAYGKSTEIYGAYGNPVQYLPPAQWCDITATLSNNRIYYTLGVYSNNSSERYNVFLTVIIGNKTAYTNYLGYLSYSTPWSDNGDIALTSDMISDGYVNVSFTLGVGASWRTTEATCKVPAGAPTVSAPTKEIMSKGYPTSSPTRMVAEKTIVRINMSGTPSSTTHSAIKNYTLYIDGVKQTPTTNNYFDLPTLSAGTHTIKYYATDDNGVDSTDSSTLSLLYETYTPAVINSVTSQRWDSQNPPPTGHAKDDGTYARLSLTFTPAKIGNTNLTTYWKAQVSSFTSANQTTSGAEVFSGSVLTDSTYQVKYSVWDDYNSTPIERADTISMAGRGALDLYFDNGVHGIGFGTAGEAGKANFKFTPYFECNNVMVSLVDVVYPVGSIYMSVNNVNPSSLFPTTTWTQICGRFLLGAGSNEANTDNTYGTLTAGQINRTAGEKGGSKDDVPAHTHSVAAVHWNKPSSWCTIDEHYGNVDHSTTTGSTGNANGVLPPYLVVYMWQRTA